MPTPLPIATRSELKTMLFGDAMNSAVESEKVRRESWPADVYCMVVNGTLCIHKPVDSTKPESEHWDGKLHPMIVNDGDIAGDDWVIIQRM
jgi:hypothetical protein